MHACECVCVCADSWLRLFLVRYRPAYTCSDTNANILIANQHFQNCLVMTENVVSTAPNITSSNYYVITISVFDQLHVKIHMLKSVCTRDATGLNKPCLLRCPQVDQLCHIELLQRDSNGRSKLVVCNWILWTSAYHRMRLF